MIGRGLYTILFLLVCLAASAQDGIRLDHTREAGISRVIRPDKKAMVRTFGGEKLKGPVTILPDGSLLIEEKAIKPDDIMMISGFVKRNSREKAGGLAITIGAGLVFPFALYYFLGGIAWAMPNGIFIGATVLVFDLLLAYTGTNLMGIFPRRFSTLNWQVILPAPGNNPEVPIPLPNPSD